MTSLDRIGNDAPDPELDLWDFLGPAVLTDRDLAAAPLTTGRNHIKSDVAAATSAMWPKADLEPATTERPGCAMKRHSHVHAEHGF